MTGGRAWKVRALGAALVLALNAAPAVAQQTGAAWVAAWGTAMQPIPALADPPPLYRTPPVAGRTVRQIIYPTVSGASVRLRVSNIYGKAPLVIERLQIAQAAGGAATRAGSTVSVSFGGKPGIRLAPGQEADSDPLSYSLHAGEPYALSAYMGGAQTMTVWHRVSNQYNYVSAPGDHSGDAEASAYHERFTQIAWVNELDVAVPPGGFTVAAIGDSITDGLRSSINANRRWPDGLARRMVSSGVADVGVINLGISGNRLLSNSACYGTALEQRFAHDALGASGVKAVVLLIGINDINFAAMPPRAGLDCDTPHTQVDAHMLIEAYQRVIAEAHQRGVRIYGATLTPADLPPAREALRQSVNQWIRTAGAFDGVIDFDAALRDPRRPTHLQSRYDSGDGIHPSDAGYAVMADTVPEKIFGKTR